MGDWTSQNRTKRDGRNNQEEEQQQQEKKATYKTAAELAVKNMYESHALEVAQLLCIYRTYMSLFLFLQRPMPKLTVQRKNL